LQTEAPPGHRSETRKTCLAVTKKHGNTTMRGGTRSRYKGAGRWFYNGYLAGRTSQEIRVPRSWGEGFKDSLGFATPRRSNTSPGAKNPNGKGHPAGDKGALKRPMACT